MSSSQFLTPVGRLVQGSAFEPQTKNQQGAPLVIQSGPNAGQPTQRYFIGVAFKKGDPTVEAFIQQLRDVGRASWPQWHDATGRCTHPRFSLKVMDGDGVDDNGKPNASKEGFAGHWVVKFSSSFPPKCYHAGHYQAHEVITDKMLIRRGYFVRVAGTAEGNGNTAKPGLYVNLNMVELSAQGPEIVSGPDAASVFGASPPATLPAGATPLPMVAAAPMPMAAPAPLPVVPNTAFVGMPTPAPMAPAPAPAPAPMRQMTAKAGGYTYEALVAAGWTDATLRSEGMML